MLVTSDIIIKNAKSRKIAIGAFNTNNYEFTKAIIDAAEEMNSNVIIQTTQNAIKYAGFKTLSSIVRSLAEDSNVKIALHLDHGKELKYVIKAIQHGWTSIMIDASAYDFEKNVKMTKAVVKIAHEANIPVEAELGPIPKANTDFKAIYTDPHQAEEFVNATDVDFLAVAIGNAHGIYKNPHPQLNVDVLKEIRKRVDVPLVMHGGSGLPNDQIKLAIKNGITKINIDTELRIAFSSAIENYFKSNPESYSIRRYLGLGINAVKEKVKEKISLFRLEK